MSVFTFIGFKILYLSVKSQYEFNSDSENISARIMGDQDDVYMEVMKTAFDVMRSDSDFISVNNLNVNKKILNLFSPLISSALSSIPCCASTSIILPDVSIVSIQHISQLLHGGLDSDVTNKWTPDERKELLEVVDQLGLSSFINKENGAEVTSTPPRDEPPSESIQPQKVNPMTIKKEKETSVEDPVEPAPPPSPTEPMEQGEPAEKQKEPVQPQSNPTDAEAPAQDDVKNQCQKCHKSFSSVDQLKNHYAVHFLSLLKKKFESHYKIDSGRSSGKCLICQRIFPSLQKMLLHIGVVHDKINVILKSKGYRELPPFSVTQNQEKPSTTTLQDVKPPVPPQASPKPTPSSSPKTLAPSSSTSAMPAVPGPPPPPQTPVRDSSSNKPGPAKIPEIPASEKKKLDEECNFDLKCQVCKQTTGSLHLLEQHLCR